MSTIKHLTALALSAVLAACAAAPGSVRVREAPVSEATEAPVPTEPVVELHAADGRLSLAKLLQHAARHNPRILAAREAWYASRWRRDQVATLPDPRIMVGWFAEEVQTRTGPQEWAVGFQQVIPWPGALAAEGAVADTESDAARVREWQAARDVLIEVTTSFLEYRYLSEAAEIQDRVVSVWQRLVGLALEGGRGDRARLPELVRAETLLAQARHDDAVLLELMEVEKERLRSLLTLPATADLGRPQRVSLPRFRTSRAKAIDAAWSHNQELLLAEIEVRKARALVDRARATTKPDFTVGGRYLVTGERTDADPSGNGDDPVLFELGLRLPVGPRSRAQVAEARHRVHQKLHAREAVRQKLRADVAQAWWKIENARRLDRLYTDDLLPQAERSARAAEALLVEGATTFAGVIETTASWHHFQLAAVRARIDYLQGLARLERLVGAPLSTLGPRTEGER